MTLRYLLLTSLLLSTPAWAQEEQVPPSPQEQDPVPPKADDDALPAQEEDAPLPPQEEAVAPQSEPSSEDLALEAHAVLMDHCAQAASKDTTLAAASAVVVSDVWARVSEQVGRSQEPYLLYWRGVLEQCLDQEDRALQDLRAFLSVPVEGDLLMELVRDARKRVRRLERALGPPPPQRTFGIVMGLGLAAGTGVTVGISSWRWEQGRVLKTQLENQVNPGDNISSIRTTMEGHLQASRVWGAVAVGLGVGSAISFVVAATARRTPGRLAGNRPPTLVPFRNGAALVWQGQW